MTSAIDSSANGIKSKSDRKLGSLLVEPFKQFKIGVYVIISTLVFTSLALAMFLHSFWQQYQHVMSIFEVVDPEMQWELVTSDVFLANAMKISVLFVVFILITMGLVFRVTHRYYGPLISIEKFVDKIARGDYSSRIRIRKKDEMVRLVGKLNHMAEKLESRYAGTREEKKAQASSS